MAIIKINKKPLIQTAFEVLLKNLGPSKTTELWQVFTLPQDNYLTVRKKLFNNKSLHSVWNEAKKFNKK